MGIKRFKKVLVANRGEIAIRVFRALSELGITSVGIYSKEDRRALFRSNADEAYELNPDKGPVDAYLDINTIIRIAKEHNVDAIHPGYGFLSENPELVDACEQNGIVFIGPSAELMRKMGDKISSKEMAIQADVPVIPGVEKALHTLDEVIEVAEKVGYPVMLKASNGGGGRGMRIVDSAKDMPKEFEEAKNESKKAFGADQIFVEKYLRNTKHIEVQILGDTQGHVVHLFDRDCSVQRRHQKVIEIAPAFSVPERVRKQIFDASIRLAEHVGYKNAGTLEFLVDGDNHPYFIEMNPRIQVEHSVSETVTGIDLVQAQVLVAEGYPLDSEEIGIVSQGSITCNGYSIQTRITTEDPLNNFLPDTGIITTYRASGGNGIRLDGNAFEGAEVSPYYDSLLVKVVSHGRTFEQAVEKSIRALREMRIIGVKTNMPFLINVLNHKDFREGRCDTTFIENNPDLFILPESNDRSAGILRFLGEKMVNDRKGAEKPHFDAPVFPVYDHEKPVHGSRDEFLKLGAEGFTQKILGEKKLYITDTTMRDAHQSLMATRMRTKDLLGASGATNAFLAPAFSVEAWGGATFDTQYRFLKESPWFRLESLRKMMPNTLIQMLLRASNAVGYSNYPDNVVKTFIKRAAKAGVDVFRIFDSLNWVENMKMPIDTALNTGKIVEGAICYTGDILNPDETKYTLDYYVKKAKELESLGVHIFTIKDMAGLLKPYAAEKLVSALKAELKIPVNLHTHDSTGNGVSTLLKAAEAGLDIADCAIDSMSSMTSNPCMSSLVQALKGTERDTGLDTGELTKLSQYYASIRPIYKQFESGMNAPNTEIYKYEIPGGQYSNLLAQVKEMGAGDNFEEIKGLYKEANELLGNIVKVTPSSKVVGDLAIFMFKNGLTKDNILDKGRTLSYPDSVIEYFQGYIGQPEGGFPKELQKIVLKDLESITERPGSLMPDVDFDYIKNGLKEHFYMEKMEDSTTLEQKALSYALYPKVYEGYCKHIEAYHDVTGLDSHVYFYGLREGEETELIRTDDQTMTIRFIDMSEPDDESYRNLTFEVNGSRRVVKVLDKNLEVKTDRRLKADKDNPAHLGSMIPGTVGQVMVKSGDEVDVNTPLLTVEAMKMETTVTSPVKGKIDHVYVKAGEQVNQEDLLISFELEPVKN